MRHLSSLGEAVPRAASDEIRLFVTLRNEGPRLPEFFEHYRQMGVDRFFVIDNGSDDNSVMLAQAQPNTHIWVTDASYKQSRFGMDWMNALLRRYGHGHWCVSVDADERLVLPQEDQDLQRFIQRLAQQGREALGAVMVDLFPKGPLDGATRAVWLDPAPLHWAYQPKLQNSWVRGGIRARYFFADRFERAPTLNKIPLIKRHWRYAYVHSTHSVLPRQINHVLGPHDPMAPRAALLHDKFAPSILEKSAEELSRRQHFQNPDLYQHYHRHLSEGPNLWFEGAVVYEGPAQLCELGFTQPLTEGTNPLDG